MSLALNRPGASRGRSAVLAIFIAFTLLFLAYVDLSMVFDDRAFRTGARSFWNIYNDTYLAFFGVVLAVLATAVVLFSWRSEPGDAPHKRTLTFSMLGAALLSIVAWWLFFSIHGFAISVLAVLTTFGVILASAATTFRNTSTPISYRHALIPTILTVLCMAAVVILTILSYLTLNTVSPGLFQANLIELTIVLTIMGIATLIAAIFVIRALLYGLPCRPTTCVGKGRQLERSINRTGSVICIP